MELSDKFEIKLNELQREIGDIHKNVVGLQKDVEHMNMKLDAYVVASNERIIEINLKMQELQRQVYELEKKMIWASGVAFALATVLSYLIKLL
jgi:predicted  nucleic acid-binding Zn-ribbon protein